MIAGILWLALLVAVLFGGGTILAVILLALSDRLQRHP